MSRVRSTGQGDVTGAAPAPTANDVSVTGAIVAEFVGSSAGLGYAIQATNFNLDVATTFAVVVLLSVIGMTLHAIVVLLSNWLVFWSPTQKAATRDL